MDFQSITENQGIDFIVIKNKRQDIQG